MIRGKVILGNLGRIILIIGVAMLTCLPWSIAYQETVILPILKASMVTIMCGGLLLYAFYQTGKNINFKEGFALVSLGWLGASIFGALPYLFSGYLPSLADAVFETVSGFSTTGATVVGDVESWPKGLLFWRSLTQWLGGMGIIVLVVAVMSNLGSRAKQLFKAEIPGGRISENISPRIRENARMLWITYLVLSIICFLLLYSLGMDFFDALCHTFTTMATGGFSTKNTSIVCYTNPWIQWTLTLFMLLAGTNFALHYFACKHRSLMTYIKNSEFKLYVGIIGIASLLIFLSLNNQVLNSAWHSNLQTACFQVVSIVTTTGYSVVDYNLWPPIGTGIILMLMFVGGCSGSTGGGMKPGRYLIIWLRTKIELKKMVHPKAVLPLQFGGRLISEDLLINVLQFFFLYIILLCSGFLVLCSLGIDMVSSFTASAACLGNVGPGLGQVGPMHTFYFMPDLAKYILSMLMLVGRLEIYPILVLFLPAFWRE